MTLPINLSTGPVQLSPGVMAAIAEPPISHRSPEFIELFTATKEILCREFQAQEVYIVSGSGTLANEVMMQEIKGFPGQGLILANGEFGTRLMQQASRNNLQFTLMEMPWGETFDMRHIAEKLATGNFSWLLFCHCETSTGVINNLETITDLCQTNQCGCFVDCMSTVGTTSLNLSKVTMATASSGKGLASIPGLAIIFANISPEHKLLTPIYLDLAHYKKSAGIPFTIASNLLKPLYVSISEKLCRDQYERSRLLAEKVYSLLSRKDLIPYAGGDSKVFTIVLPESGVPGFMNSVKGLELSGESDYLKKRGWKQLAIFGYYNEEDVKNIEDILVQAIGMAWVNPPLSLVE